MESEQAVRLNEDLECSFAVPRHPSHVSPLSHCYLSALSLHHFRNYASVRLELDKRPVILTGNNGAGKTNILEAVSLLIPGRGLRRAKLGEMDCKHSASEAPWVVTATIQGMQGEVKIGLGRDPESGEQADKRLLRVDGKSMRSQAELARHIAVLWLTPQTEQLFNQGTSDGRKFLDRLVYSFDPEHAGRINEYEYAMRERNRLLAEGRFDTAWLDALEQTMAETGAAIAQARISALDSLNHAIGLSSLSFPRARIAVAGKVEALLQSGKAAVDVETAFKDTLRAARPQDRAAGRALSGTHRSEMQVFHIEKGLPAGACSTGEQKALLLSVVLAQVRSGTLWKGVVPVLLLDEVAAHLDAIRRLELFEEICQIGAQVWMTGTDAGSFAELKDKAQFFTVDNGMIAPGK